MVLRCQRDNTIFSEDCLTLIRTKLALKPHLQDDLLLGTSTHKEHFSESMRNVDFSYRIFRFVQSEVRMNMLPLYLNCKYIVYALSRTCVDGSFEMRRGDFKLWNNQYQTILTSLHAVLWKAFCSFSISWNMKSALSNVLLRN